MPSTGLRALLDRQPHARAALGTVVGGGRDLSHAYLITGPGGSGKRELARELAAAALAAPSATGPLDFGLVDDALQVRVQHGKHPDLVWVSPASGAGILVDDIEQQVLAAAGSTPLVAARRVFVIEQCERLHPSAANRLLKTLEEPPPYVHLILLSSHAAEVMETIASRCQPVRLVGLSQSELVEQLVGRGIAHETALSAAAIAGADGDLAALLAGAEVGVPLRAAAEQFAVGALRGGVTAPWQPLLDRAQAAGERAADAVAEEGGPSLEHLEGRERTSFQKLIDERAKRAARQARTAELDTGLALTAIWLRDLWVLALGAADAVRAQDQLGALEQALVGLSGGDVAQRAVLAPRLAAVVDEVERARSALRVNATEGLLLDALTIRIGATVRGQPVAA